MSLRSLPPQVKNHPGSCEYIPPLGTYFYPTLGKRKIIFKVIFDGIYVSSQEGITFLVQKKNNQTSLSLDPFQRKSTSRNRLLFPRPISNSNLQYKSPLFSSHLQVPHPSIKKDLSRQPQPATSQNPSSCGSGWFFQAQDFVVVASHEATFWQKWVVEGTFRLEQSLKGGKMETWSF